MLEVIQPQKLNHKILRQFCEKYSFYIPELHKNIYSKKDLRKFLEARFDFFKYHFDDLKITAHNPENGFPWLANSSIVEVLLPDSPFIVDTIVSTCRSLNANINLIIHPVLKVERDDRGLLLRTAFPQQSGEAESYVYLEIDHLEIKKLQRLKKELEGNLAELRKIFGDSPYMEAQVDGLTFVNTQINEEVTWLKENFVLHGLSVCKNNKLVGPHFGLLKKPSIRKNIGKEVDLKYAGQSLFFQESTITSHINKNRQIYGGVIFHEKSNLVFAGHFKERTEITLKNDIPAIRHKLKNIARKLKIAPTSYTQKELYKIAQSLPVGLLMTRSTGFLYRWLNAATSFKVLESSKPLPNTSPLISPMPTTFIGYFSGLMAIS